MNFAGTKCTKKITLWPVSVSNFVIIQHCHTSSPYQFAHTVAITLYTSLLYFSLSIADVENWSRTHPLRQSTLSLSLVNTTERTQPHTIRPSPILLCKQLSAPTPSLHCALPDIMLYWIPMYWSTLLFSPHLVFFCKFCYLTLSWHTININTVNQNGIKHRRIAKQ